MVKSTTRCLKKQLGNVRLTYEELFTVLIEVEAVLNSRLPTPISSFDWKEIAGTSCPPPPSSAVKLTRYMGHIAEI